MVVLAVVDLVLGMLAIIVAGFARKRIDTTGQPLLPDLWKGLAARQLAHSRQLAAGGVIAVLVALANVPAALVYGSEPLLGGPTQAPWEQLVLGARALAAVILVVIALWRGVGLVRGRRPA
ncbi:hypothetical protein SAMN04489732_12977 [Amycolatopsis saalfeldensis]|uniref:Uncharacterized protein n=1 Tax=Amycolatopsis saalfeldensis TaxID=394193 RepID=A0A1H8YNN3_9PSEU|nr:hypothetical protein SAMN04489732_12977 [Amycolatopsis saalfeldensis]